MEIITQKRTKLASYTDKKVVYIPDEIYQDFSRPLEWGEISRTAHKLISDYLEGRLIPSPSDFPRGTSTNETARVLCVPQDLWDKFRKKTFCADLEISKTIAALMKAYCAQLQSSNNPKTPCLTS